MREPREGRSTNVDFVRAWGHEQADWLHAGEYQIQHVDFSRDNPDDSRRRPGADTDRATADGFLRLCVDSDFCRPPGGE